MRDHLALDLRDAWRALRRSRAATTVAILTFALGIGVNTAVFTVFESILLNRLPYAHADQLVHVAQSNARGVGGVSAWVAAEWQARGRAVASVGLYTDGQWVMADDGNAEVFRGQRVNGEFFDTLGVTPLLGRLLTPADDRPRCRDVVVLTHDLWVSRFGADPAIVERTLTLNGSPYRVVGVLPETFHPLPMSNAAEEPRIFAPLGVDAAEAARCRDCTTYRGIARLQPGVGVAQAQAELSAVMAQFAGEFPADFPAGTTASLQPLRDQLTRGLRPALWIALGAAVCVLLIACANLAALQLIRASARAGEFAVRGAIGASRWRVARQVVVETLIVAAAGCALGIAAGQAGLRALLAAAPRELPRLGEIALDGRVLAAAIAACLLTGIAAALAPAWLAARVELNDALKRHGERNPRAAGSRVRAALVIAEVALAFVLVATAGLLVRTVQRLLAVDAGFDAAHVLTMTPVVLGQPAELLAEKRRMIDAARAVPGVVAAGMVNDVPLSHRTSFVCFVDGRPAATAAVNVFWVDGDYFAALRIPLRRGRLLTAHDGLDAPAAVLVSESFARRRLAGSDPLGQRIRLADRDPLVIVGVVGDVRNEALDAPADEAVYQPLAVDPWHYIRLIARTSGDPRAIEGAVRTAIRGVDSSVPVFHVQPMEEYVASWMAPRRFALALMATFGLVALVLAGIGLYGVMAFAVTTQTAELGIRAALGATGTRLLALVLGRGLALVLTGLGLGALLAGTATRLLGSLLFGVSPLDAVTFAATAGVIAAAGLAACALPAGRAARIDPVTAMRE